MKTISKLIGLMAGVITLSTSLAAHAALYNFTQSGGVYTAAASGLGQVIPDNNATGVGYGLNFADSGVSISAISVTLNMSGGYNGDLYAYLSHGDGLVVLLNRIGRSASTPDGSDTSGFSTFTLGSTFSPDVHLATGTAGSPLTGNYAPDGRNINPSSTGAQFDTASRDAMFSTLILNDPNGDWTLFFADRGALNTSTLNSWSVDITPVPEPVTWALIVSGTLCSAVQLGRLYRRRTAG